LGERIVEVLKQDRNAPVPVGGQVGIIYAVINGYLNEYEISEIRGYQEKLYEKLDHEHKEWMRRIEKGFWDKEDEEELKKVLDKMKKKK
jgi:F-type H+-transporting ATPase subunit alpha